MAETNYHINYSFEDIQRYLNGSMTAKEMHDMERAALNDPFLAAAIEGYTASDFSQSQKHLNEIAAALQGEKEKTKVVPLQQNKNYWWRVAASVAALIGVGAFTFYLVNSGSKDSKKAQSDLVQVQPKESAAEKLNDSNASAPAKDTALPMIADNKLYNKKEATVDQLQLHYSKTQPSAEAEKSASSIVPFNQFPDSGNVTISANRNAEANNTNNNDAVAATPEIQKEMKVDSTIFLKALPGRVSGITTTEGFLNKLNTFSGRVYDNNNKPLPGALVNAGKKTATATDANGNFLLTSADSILNVYVSSVGYQSLNAQLSTKYTNNLYVIPDHQSLSEMVVSGYSNKKKSLNKSATPDTDSAYPLGGWQNFSNYVQLSLRGDDTSETYSSAGGNVELEFWIDKQGNPYDIKITKPLNDSTNAAAVDIIKNGPRWMPAQKNKKAKVTIPFH